MTSITLALTSSTLTASGAPLSVTATVTNSAAVPARVVLGAFPPSETVPGARAWAQIERPLRTIAPGTTEQFTVTIVPPPGTAAGQYGVRFIAYDADRPPEEFSDQAQTLDVVVPATGAKPAPPGVPWWVWVVAAALIVVIGVVAYFLLRPRPTPPPPPPSPTPTTATPSPSPSNPCTPPYVPRLARPGDLTCVTVLSAAEAKADNDPDLQKARKDPSGPYGPETCVQGYVWREAWDGDVTCVIVSTRTRTYWENQGHPEGTP